MTTDPITILVTSAGATNALNVMDALRKTDLNLRFIAADIDPLAAGLYMADKHYVIPPAKDPSFMGRIIEICESNRVDVIMPIYSAELMVFARNKVLLREKGLKLCVAEPDSLARCDDKLRTIAFFREMGVRHPATWTTQDLPVEGQIRVPLFIKRRTGSGSKDAMIVRTLTELQQRVTPDHIIQEFVDGDEYTVDVVSDLDGRFIAASPRVRSRMFGELSVRGVTVRDEEIIAKTKTIVEALRLPGPSNVQCKRASNGELVFIEVNPRFASGGLPLAVAAGLNIPEIIIRLLVGMPVPEIHIEEHVIMNRFWSSQFLKSTQVKGEYEVLD